ncbi:MAG: HNH endonuclease [Sedimentisphaerales bacterium]
MVSITIKVPNWLDMFFAWPSIVYRRWKYGEAFRRIYLDEGLWAIVDTADYYRYAGFKWCIGGCEGKFYAVRGQRIGPDDLKIVRLHRLIMNAPEGLLVDHRNSDGLDNRRTNLRIATHAENTQNNRKRKGTTSKYIGVSFDKKADNWISRIMFKKKAKWLGSFDDEIAAAKAYDDAAKKYYGEFARLNFPEPQIPQIPQII